jgi:enoyl-CoA hydratase/carnithine racemase
MAYVKIGLNPDGAGTFFLSRSVPPQLAAELAMTGAPIAAPRLAQLGVVNKIVPNGKALEEGRALAGTLASGATRAIARIKQLLNAAQLGTYETQLELERSLFVEALHGDEAGEGIGAFLDKRKARFNP